MFGSHLPRQEENPYARRSHGNTVGEARRRAHAKADELLRTGGRGRWSGSDDLIKYIDEVTIPAIERAPLRPSTLLWYKAAVALLKKALNAGSKSRGYTITGGTTFRALEDALRYVAKEHGRENAHHVRTIASKYLLQPLVRDGLITHNVLRGEQIELGLPANDTDKDARRGGRALSKSEYIKVVTHLLSIMPEDLATSPAIPENTTASTTKRRFGFEDRVAKWRNVIDLTLLQAATGLRVGEATGTRWNDVTVRGDHTFIHVSSSLSKTHISRDVPILLPAAVTRLQERKRFLNDPHGFIIGSPAYPDRPWEPRNRSKMIVEFYRTLAHDLNIPLLYTARSHVWRARCLD